jgi:hypothetical protein
MHSLFADLSVANCFVCELILIIYVVCRHDSKGESISFVKKKSGEKYQVHALLNETSIVILNRFILFYKF